MAQITFTDAIGAAVLRNDMPVPANRFSGWTPATRPVTSSSTNLATGALCTYEFRRDYMASFDLNYISAHEATVPTITFFAGGGTGGGWSAGARYSRVSAIFGSAVSVASSEVGDTLLNDEAITWAWDEVPGATGYRLWLTFGTGAGGENFYKDVGAVTTYTDSTGGLGYTAGTPPTTGGIVDWVSIADRLCAHLLTGGTCSVECEDTVSSTYATCGLAPGATPTLRLTNAQTKEYTLSLSLLNRAGSPVQMVCLYS